MSWSKDQVVSLIQEYEKYPVLYNPKMVNYKNEHARNQALQSIVEVLKNIRPNVTAMDIKNKFGALRSNFLLEHRKFRLSQKTGTGTKDLYHPSIWYYELIKFVLEHTLPKLSSYDSISLAENEEQFEEHFTQESNAGETMDNAVEWDEIFSPGQFSADDLNEPNTSIVKPPSKSRKGRNKSKSNDINDTFLKTASSALENVSTVLKNNLTERIANRSDDQIDAFLNFIGTKLRKIKNSTVYDEVEVHIINIVNDAVKLDRYANA